MENTYRIGNKNIHIKSVFPRVHNLCKDYLTEGAADFSVETFQDDIDKERMRYEEACLKEGKSIINYSDGYLESLAVYRKIAAKMLDYDTFLFHGSTVCVDGEAFIFTALSGTGKSTHTALWRKLLGDKVVMINDDKPLIKITGSRAIVYGTPYDGKHHLSTNMSAPVKAICILKRAEKNSIEKIGSDEAFPMIYQQTYNTETSEGAVKTLALLNKLLGLCDFYILHCNMDIEAAKLAYETMRSK